MSKKIVFLLLCLISMAVSPIYAAEVSEKPIYLNNKLMAFENPILSEKGCMIVPVRELSDMLGFDVQWNGERQRVIAYNEIISINMYIGDTHIKVLSTSGDDKDVESILAPAIINSITYIPIRMVAEAFGARVIWDNETDTVYICTEEFLEEMEKLEEETKEEEVASHTFYSQYAPEYIEQYGKEPYNWTDGRNGYCYVTAYAMLLSDLTRTVVTPKAVADINLEKCGNATICYHWDIVSRYGCRLVQALPDDSPYLKEYDADRGLTMIDNSEPARVEAAIKAALDLHPEGVLVRDTSMPHTMVAIGYDDEQIFFNDPAQSAGGKTWSETCLKNKELTTITAIIALDR